MRLDRLAYGKKGEERFKKILSANKISFEDVSDNMTEGDIKTKNHLYEVKTYNRTSEGYFRVYLTRVYYNNIRNPKPSWFPRCIIDGVTDIVYMTTTLIYDVKPYDIETYISVHKPQPQILLGDSDYFTVYVDIPIKDIQYKVMTTTHNKIN